MSGPLDLDALENIAKAAIDKGNRLQQVSTVTMGPHTIIDLIERVRRAEELAEDRLEVAESYRAHRDELDEQARRVPPDKPYGPYGEGSADD